MKLNRRFIKECPRFDLKRKKTICHSGMKLFYSKTCLKWTTPNYEHSQVRRSNFCWKGPSLMWTPFCSPLWYNNLSNVNKWKMLFLTYLYLSWIVLGCSQWLPVVSRRIQTEIPGKIQWHPLRDISSMSRWFVMISGRNRSVYFDLGSKSRKNPFPHCGRNHADLSITLFES
jgi:hypothetical protein